LGPRYIYKYVQSNYWPIDNNIIREAAVVHRLADKLADAEHGEFDARSIGDAKRGQTPAPRINVPISESPVMSMRRTPSPMPGLQMNDGQQVEMAEFSQHAQRPPAFSAIPIAQHSPSKASRHRVADDTYAEVGEEALASPTSARHLNVYRDRQHSGTPLSPSLYASPPESPAGSRAGMRREGSTASFATATSEPYSDGEGDQFAGYAR
jgi:phospholipid-translocating ATPase